MSFEKKTTYFDVRKIKKNPTPGTPFRLQNLDKDTYYMNHEHSATDGERERKKKIILGAIFATNEKKMIGCFN